LEQWQGSIPCIGSNNQLIFKAMFNYQSDINDISYFGMIVVFIVFVIYFTHQGNKQKDE